MGIYFKQHNHLLYSCNFLFIIMLIIFFLFLKGFSAFPLFWNPEFLITHLFLKIAWPHMDVHAYMTYCFIYLFLNFQKGNNVLCSLLRVSLVSSLSSQGSSRSLWMTTVSSFASLCFVYNSSRFTHPSFSSCVVTLGTCQNSPTAATLRHLDKNITF